MTDVVCGLDFGTSNSTLALIDKGAPVLVPLDQGRGIIPSAIFYNFENDTTVFGRQAVEDYVLGSEGRLMRSLKSILGTSLINERTVLRRRSVAFTEVIADFLHHVKRVAEAHTGTTLRRVVAGRPVHFIDDDADADRKAEEALAAILKSVGFTEVHFQYEPIAAAYQYNSTADSGGGLALIADIGGGTSDFSILAAPADGTPDAASILATHGVHLGGTDIDRLVSLDTIMPLLGRGSPMRDKDLPVPNWLYNDLATWHKINGLYTNQIRTMVRQIALEAAKPQLIERLLDVLERRLGHVLLGQAEAIKIRLSETDAVALPLALGRESLTLDVTAADLGAYMENWTAAIGAALSETLALAAVKPRDIATVFLTGGTTLSPVVRALVKRGFPRAKIVSGDNFGAVGLGLAIDAARRFG